MTATYAVIYNKELKDIHTQQTTCMACGDAFNTYIVQLGECNFTLYPPKAPVEFKKVEKLKMDWEYEQAITEAFLGTHTTMVGDDEGLISAFGVYLVRTQSDYVNRLQFEFEKAIVEVAGEYGSTLAGELLMEGGHTCGFFTYGGIMTSPEWNEVVKPYLKSQEDWIKGFVALANAFGWGYHTIVELSRERAVFRNYNDFEDLSYMRMYGKSEQPIHWANSGSLTGLMQLVYNTELIHGERIETEESFREMRRSSVGYKTNMRRGVSCGDDYMEVEIYL